MTDKTTPQELREAIVAVARITSNNAQSQAARMLGFEIQVAIVDQLAQLGEAVGRIAVSLESLESMTRDDVDSYRGDTGFDTTVPLVDGQPLPDAEADGPERTAPAAGLAALLDQAAEDPDYLDDVVRVSARKSERQANGAYDDDDAGLTTDAFTALKNKSKKGKA